MSFDANTPYQYPSPSQSPSSTPMVYQTIPSTPTSGPAPFNSSFSGLGTRYPAADGEATATFEEQQASMAPPPPPRLLSGPGPSETALGTAARFHIASVPGIPPSSTYSRQGDPALASPALSSGLSSISAPSEPPEYMKQMISSALHSALPVLRAQSRDDARALFADHQRQIQQAVKETMRGELQLLRNEMDTSQTAFATRLEERLDERLASKKQTKKARGQGTSAESSRSPLKARDGNAPAPASDADDESNADASEIELRPEISPAATTRLHAELRKVLAWRAGIDPNMHKHPRIHELEYIASASEALYHPRGYTPHATDTPTPSCERPAGAESDYRMLRFDFSANAHQEPNRTYIEQIATWLHSRGKLYGLTPDIPVGSVVTLIERRFANLAIRHRNWLEDPDGKGRSRQNDTNRKRERLETKANQRAHLAGVAVASNNRRPAPAFLGQRRSESSASSGTDVGSERADFRSAYHLECQSAEDTDPSPSLLAGAVAKVLRCRRPEWGSAQLHIVKRHADKYRARQFRVTDSENELEFEGDALPSVVQKWMVNAEFASAHPDVCAKVLDNCGPFLGQFPARAHAVIGGPKEWGSNMPSRKRRRMNDGEVVEEQTHPLAFTFRLPIQSDAHRSTAAPLFSPTRVGDSSRGKAPATPMARAIGNVHSPSAIFATVRHGALASPVGDGTGRSLPRRDAFHSQPESVAPSTSDAGAFASSMILPQASSSQETDPPSRPSIGLTRASRSQPRPVVSSPARSVPHASPDQSPGHSVIQSVCSSPRASSVHLGYSPHASPGVTMESIHPSRASPQDQPVTQPMGDPLHVSFGHSLNWPHVSRGPPSVFPHAQPLGGSATQPVDIMPPASPAQSMALLHASPGSPMGFAHGHVGGAIYPSPSSSQQTSLPFGLPGTMSVFEPTLPTPSGRQEWSSFQSSQTTTSSSQTLSFATGHSLASSQGSAVSGQYSGQSEEQSQGPSQAASQGPSQAESQAPSQAESQDGFFAWAGLLDCATRPAASASGGGSQQSILAHRSGVGGVQHAMPHIDLAGLPEDNSLEHISVAEYLRQQRAYSAKQKEL